MKNILIINGWHSFSDSTGLFNKSLFNSTKNFFMRFDYYFIKETQMDKGYTIEEEVSKYVWADIIIYHTPIWWFSIPFKFKKYFDEILTAGYHNGIWTSDGRSSENPEINYGTGGLLHGKKYILTTSWNAPKGAFTLPGEFFAEIDSDQSVLSGFHAMNRYIGLDLIKSIPFYDIEKNADIPKELKKYTTFLDNEFKREESLIIQDKKLR